MCYKHELILVENVIILADKSLMTNAYDLVIKHIVTGN